jgi:hypothetical protein
VGITPFQRQEERAKKLLTLAIKTLQKKNLGETCSLFAYDKKWQNPPLYVLALHPELQGTKLVDQLRPDAVWSKILIGYDFLNRPLLETMLQASKPQWINFYRFNKLFHAYIQVVEKNKTKYILGIGFFPDDKEFLGKTLVNTITDNIASSSILEVTNIINNIHGRLILGDVFATIMDQSGLCWADGKNYLLVGQNLLTGNNKALYELIMKKINQEHKKAGSFEFKKGNGIFKIFYNTHHDPKDNTTFIVITQFCNNVTQEVVESMAQSIATILKKGDKSTLDQINLSEQIRSTVVTHDLSAIIIDKKTGIVLAGTEPQFFAQLGRNFFDYYDQKQQPVGQIIKGLAAENQSGHASRFERNALERIYFLNVDTSFGTFTIMINNYYPYPKKELAPILADDTIRYLQRKQNFEAFDYLGEELSPFLIGDVTIKIYDTKGFQWLSGTSYESMWSQDKVLGQTEEGWVADQRDYPIETKYFRKALPHFLEQPEALIVGASYSELIQ